MAGAYGMLLDRGLTVEQLDLALEVARADPDPTTNRRTLAIRLRDLVSDQEAEGKTKKCLTRVWLNPPAQACQMITWARVNGGPEFKPGLLHFGAMLATFPFVGVVARVVGQHLATDGSVHARIVRAEVRRLVGDRSSVDVAARKTYTTMANLGVVERRGQEILPSTGGLSVPESHHAWMIHALLLTKQASAVERSSVAGAPELLGIALGSRGVGAYAMLEEHSLQRGAVYAEA